MGIEPERFRLEWVSAGEGAKWAQIADEMAAAIKAKGPLAWWENVKEGLG
jgi:coenzyme F420-reducing hydrogenase delta subunit